MEKKKESKEWSVCARACVCAYQCVLCVLKLGGRGRRKFQKGILNPPSFSPIHLLHHKLAWPPGSLAACFHAYLTPSYSIYKLRRRPKIAVSHTNQGRSVKRSKQGNYKWLNITEGQKIMDWFQETPCHSDQDLLGGHYSQEGNHCI